MSLSTIISRPGFLLLEAVIACAIMSMMVLFITHYHWHMQIQSLQVSNQINLLLDVYTFFEKKQYKQESFGHNKGKSRTISWQKLPAIKNESVSMRPMQVELRYTVAGREHIYKLVSVAL